MYSVPVLLLIPDILRLFTIDSGQLCSYNINVEGWLFGHIFSYDRIIWPNSATGGKV